MNKCDLIWYTVGVCFLWQTVMLMLSDWHTRSLRRRIEALEAAKRARKVKQ
jgi:hypothetical protein